jgi:DNA-binding response OmpR family regulator
VPNVSLDARTTAVENLPPGILLVEEYGALGVAISSALHKFAPLHGVAVAHSFAEAETAAATMRPELFVLDLDPPPSGEIEFFNKLKANYPEARVLVIAAGTSRELRAERGTAGAIQFIEKPFDLAEFGAAVQALLGPWAAPPSSGLRGTLRNLQVVDIVELKCLAGSTATVQIEATEDRSGEIHFQKGQICHAVTGTIVGLAALEEIVRWPDARVSEAELPTDSPRTIDAAWELVLLQVVRKLDQDSGRYPLGGDRLPRSSAAKTGKKILVVDDTEMLLIFVADVLGTADQNFQILKASSGAEGLRLAASERPDLLLLDYCLTDMTGDKVCRALLKNPVTARIPVLMMSGHLIELAKTTEEYENVVAGLPKPFLSGALINAVEKVLAAGPLPQTPRPKAIPSAAEPTSPPTSTPRAKSSAPPASHGDGAKTTSRAKPAPPEPAPVSLPTPPTPTRTVHATSAPSTGTIVRPTEMSVTIALKVVAMQFTSALRLETATLQPCDRIVAVKMGEQNELNGVPLESGFRLGKISLGDNGQIETMRLVPTRQPLQLPFPSQTFTVGASNFQRANADSKLQLAPSPEATMRVRLTAQFELLAVELSVGFEIAAILLKARPRPVRMRNDSEGAGRPFELLEVQLDSSTELQSLLVRAVD